MQKTALSPEAQGAYPRWRANYVYVLLFLLFMFDYIDRFIIVSLFPFLQRDWGLSDTQCSLLVSAVFWSMVLFVLPVGALVDRWSRKNSIGLMAVIWSLATAAAAFTRNFTQLFVTRCAVGAGEAGYAPGGAAIISAIFKPERRSRMIGIWQASVPLGQALGIALGGVLAVALGWQRVLGVVAIPGLICAILFFWVRDYKTVNLVKSVKLEDAAPTVKMSKKDIARDLFRSKSLAFNNFAYASCAFVIVALSTWLPVYFQRYQGMEIQQSSLIAGLVMVTAIIGAPLGGILTDRWLKTKPNARMLLPAITSAIAAVFLMIALLATGASQIGLLAVVGLTIVMCTAGCVAVTQDVVHPGLRSTSYSVNVVIQHLLGSALGPLVVGALSDAWGLNKAVLILPGFLLLGAVLFFLGSFFYKRDVDRCEKVQIVF
jgi:MFS family permease